MTIRQQKIRLKEAEITKISMQNNQCIEVEVLSLGGIITKIRTPDKDGKIENIVLGYKDLEDYLSSTVYYGGIIGRTAGRIAKGTCNINGKVYALSKGENGHTLHGGEKGFYYKNWNVECIYEGEKSVGVKLSYTSEAGEEGYPGKVKVNVCYTLTDENALEITYEAQTDQVTLVNLTNHSYFNLSGDAKEDILDHCLQIKSDKIYEIDSESIPTGNILPIPKKSVFDFIESKRIGEDIDAEDTKWQSGYDHIWHLNKEKNPGLCYWDKGSGRTLEISTDQEAVVIYTMNFTDGKALANGEKAKPRYGICFETQACAIGYNEIFKEQSLLSPEKTYKQKTIWKFGISN